MENVSGVVKEDDQMDLPPGFRFHPTDEELICHYLYHKVFYVSFSCRAIGDVDLNKNEPWELPWKAKMGEKEWYFFCMRERKYPSGLRTNRATVSGYWKATCKDKEIYRGKSLLGMKKTLVFHKGRAPKGEKTNWVMHEYRLDGKFSVHNLPKTAKNGWVICRVFEKSYGGKKTHFSGLPPLMDSSPDNGSKTIKSVADSAYVPCFSNSIDVHRNQENITIIENCFNNPLISVFPRIPLSSSSFCSPLSVSDSSQMQFPGSVFLQDNSFLRALIENEGSNMSQSFKTEKETISVSQDTGLTADMNPEIYSAMSNLEMVERPFNDHDAPSTSAGPVDLHCFWNY